MIVMAGVIKISKRVFLLKNFPTSVAIMATIKISRGPAAPPKTLDATPTERIEYKTNGGACKL